MSACFTQLGLIAVEELRSIIRVASMATLSLNVCISVVEDRSSAGASVV